MRKSPAKKAFKKVKEKSVSFWKKKAWAVFSKWIRERDNYTCYTCGKQYIGGHSMQAGHFISRSHNNTLFDEQNVHAQCYHCNVIKRGNMGEYAFRLIEELGNVGFQDLLARGRDFKQWDVNGLKEIIGIYQYPPNKIDEENDRR